MSTKVNKVKKRLEITKKWSDLDPVMALIKWIHYSQLKHAVIYRAFHNRKFAMFENILAYVQWNSRYAVHGAGVKFT